MESTFVADGKGKRFSDDKPPVELFPFEVIESYAEHAAIGAKKYGPRNWERGMPWMRMVASLMRHLIAWLRGEEHDPETGSHHLTAVMWNAVGLETYRLRRIGEDDRVMRGAAE